MNDVNTVQEIIELELTELGSQNQKGSEFLSKIKSQESGTIQDLSLLRVRAMSGFKSQESGATENSHLRSQGHLRIHMEEEVLIFKIIDFPTRKMIFN